MSKFKVKGAPVLEARLATTRLQALTDASKAPRLAVRAMGLPWPKKQPADEKQFPKDITALSHVEVRQLMSYYVAYHGYAATRLGIWKGKVAIISRILQSRRSILFQKYKPEKKTSDWSEAIQGRISKNKEVRRMEALLGEAEAMVAVLDQLVWTYKSFADAASREISARAAEMELSGRSGTRFKKREDDRYGRAVR